jgi:hypothetical protein
MATINLMECENRMLESKTFLLLRIMPDQVMYRYTDVRLSITSRPEINRVGFLAGRHLG